MILYLPRSGTSPSWSEASQKITQGSPRKVTKVTINKSVPRHCLRRYRLNLVVQGELLWFLICFCLRAVGLAITLSHFYSFYRDKPRNSHLAILTFCQFTSFDTIRRYSTLLDASWRCSTQLDATWRYLTLTDANRHYSTLFDATRRYLTLLDATQRYQHYLTLFDATRRYSALFGGHEHYTSLLHWV
jgi:hypothetical protein